MRASDIISRLLENVGDVEALLLRLDQRTQTMEERALTTEEQLKIASEQIEMLLEKVSDWEAEMVCMRTEIEELRARGGVDTSGAQDSA
jgi:predicted  nucleic acid-binding Zn-ribbon protein